MSGKKTILIAIMAHAALAYYSAASADEASSNVTQGPSKSETFVFIKELTSACQSVPIQEYDRANIFDGLAMELDGSVLKWRWSISGKPELTSSTYEGKTYFKSVNTSGSISYTAIIPLDQLNTEAQLDGGGVKLTCDLKPCIEVVRIGKIKVRTAVFYDAPGKDDTEEFKQTDINDKYLYRNINIKQRLGCEKVDGERLQRAFTHLIKLHGGKKPLF